MKSLRCFFFTLLSLTIVAWSGCSRPVATVRGEVKFKDDLLKGGTVTFVSTEGLPNCAGRIEENGSYLIENITVGEYKVCVTTEYLKPPPVSQAHKMGPGKNKDLAHAQAKDLSPEAKAQLPPGYKPSNPMESTVAKNSKNYVKIPDSYSDSKTTPLSFTVKSGENTYSFDVK